MKDNTYTELEHAFFNDGYQLGKCYLGNSASSENFKLMTRQVYQYIDEFLHLFVNQILSRDGEIECHKGCAYCCSNAVFILPHEAYYIMEYIKDHFTPDVIDLFAKRIKEKANKTENMDMKTLLEYKYPCVFLQNNACSVYEARPMSCRIYLSKSIETCKNEYNDPANENEYPSLYTMPLTMGRMINEGIGRAMQDKGLRPYDWTMEVQMNLFFTHPDAFKLWLEGDKLFQESKLSDDDIRYLEIRNRGK